MQRLNARAYTQVAILVGILALAGSLYAELARAAGAACNTYASPTGSDANGNGSSSAPFASLSKLDASLSPGETGCLEAGTYGGTGTQTDLNTNGTASGQITLTAAPGTTPQVDGLIEMNGTYTTLSDLSIDGSNTFYDYADSFNPCDETGYGSQALQVNGQNDIFENNDYYQSLATLRGNGIGIGFDGDGASGANGNNVIIRDNQLHDVGRCDAYDHVIYLAAGNGAQIYGNWMYNDAHGFGVQVYPDPSNAHIYDNVIYNVGSGFTVGGGSTVSGIVIDNNIVANSTGLPDAGTAGQCVSDYWNGTPGTGDQATNNDCFDDPGGVGSVSAVSESGNITTDPQFVDPGADDFQVESTSPAAGWGLSSAADVGPVVGSAPGAAPSPAPVGAPPPAPSTPTGLTATGSDGAVTLTWTANSALDNVTSYSVYRVGQTFTGPWATTTATTFTNRGEVSNGTQYCYQISATNGTGTSAESAPVCATPRATPTAPATPTGLSATGNNGSVTLAWTANAAADNVTGYNIYRVGQTFTGPWATIAGTTFINRAQVNNGTQYCYKVSATNGIGTSAETAPVCATPR